MNLNLKSISGIILTIAALSVAGVEFGTLIAYTKAATASVGRALVDQLPFDWKIRTEADACEKLLKQRAGLIVQRDNLQQMRDASFVQLSTKRESRRKLEQDLANVGLIVRDMSSKGDEARIITGRAVTLAALVAQQNAMDLELRSSALTLTSDEHKIASADASIHGLNREIDELAKAEKERREQLASVASDVSLMQAQLGAARLRLDARDAAQPGDFGGAVAREVDDLKAQLIVANGKLNDDQGPPVAYDISREGISAEAMKIAASGSSR